MTFTQKIEELETDIVNHIVIAIEKHGEDSKFMQDTVVKITDENLMFNLSGGRHLAEISKTNLIDSSGYNYDYNAITLEELAEVADSLEI